jgi:hypothetical protein
MPKTTATAREIAHARARAKHCSAIFQLQTKIESYPKAILRARALRKMYSGIIRAYESALFITARDLEQIAIYQDKLMLLSPISDEEQEIDRLEIQLHSLMV